MFKVALLMVVSHWIQVKCPSKEEWTYTLRYSHTMEYDKKIKKNNLWY